MGATPCDVAQAFPRDLGLDLGQFRFECAGFNVSGFRSGAWGSGLRIWGSRFEVQGLGSRILGFGLAA